MTKPFRLALPVDCIRAKVAASASNVIVVSMRWNQSVKTDGDLAHGVTYMLIGALVNAELESVLRAACVGVVEYRTVAIVTGAAIAGLEDHASDVATVPQRLLEVS